MEVEIEAKWLDVNHDAFRELLVSLGAIQVKKQTDMVRATFDLPGRRSNQEWVRVRDEGDKITLSYKRHDNHGLTGTKEIILKVGDFAGMVEFLEATGFRKKSLQETRRESWTLDGAEIELDEWPWLPTFVEVETKTELEMLQIIKKLGLDLNNAMYSSVDLVYARYYDVTPEEVNEWPDIRFSEVPRWLEEKRRPAK